MNRFAQLAYGKVIYIYETHLTKDDLPQIFSPATYWVDVTGQDVEVGDIASFDENLGIVFTRPQVEEEDKFAQLDEQYNVEKAQIRQAYFDAMMVNDTEMMAKLQEDLAALNEKYDTEYDALEGEE